MDLFNQINVLNLLQEERILVQHGLKLLSTELDISELLYPAIKQPLDLIGTYGADRLQRLLIAVYGDAPLMPTLRIDFFEDIDLTTFIIIGCCVSIKKFLRLSLDSLVALKKLALELATKLQSSIVTDARIRAIIDKGPNCFKRQFYAHLPTPVTFLRTFPELGLISYEVCHSKNLNAVLDLSKEHRLTVYYCVNAFDSMVRFTLLPKRHDLLLDLCGEDISTTAFCSVPGSVAGVERLFGPYCLQSMQATENWRDLINGLTNCV